MIKKGLIVLFTCLKVWFTRHQIRRQDLLVNFVEHKKSGLIFYFGLPFRQRNATCQLAATKDYRGSCVS